MLDLHAIAGEIPDDVGAVLSPVIKLLVVGFGGLMTVAMVSKYRWKRRENPGDPSTVRRNMATMLAFYTGSAMIASLDNLLGLKDVPYENAYLGTSVSLVFTAIANAFYLWFVLEVLYVSKEVSARKRLYLGSFFLVDGLSTVSTLWLKVLASPLFLVPIVAHGAASCLVFVLVLVKSFVLSKNSENKEYRRKFASICVGTGFGLASLILFTVDALSEHATVYSVAGWLSLLALGFFLSKGYY
ncbi:MAG: hypothetical protein JW839_09980 [Candidatus Lokiarchaeota archaeon]|nr:hypothetical protein [Candidatus Lokiarchaeota archaeon]